MITLAETKTSIMSKVLEYFHWGAQNRYESSILQNIFSTPILSPPIEAKRLLVSKLVMTTNIVCPSWGLMGTSSQIDIMWQCPTPTNPSIDKMFKAFIHLDLILLKLTSKMNKYTSFTDVITAKSFEKFTVWI